MMEAVVGPEGTGRRAGLRALRVAGKTGTAQKLDRDTGTYSRKRFVAWFIGVVPADAPRLVTVAALDEPHGEVTGGGAIAAPLFAQVAAGQLGRLGLITSPQPIPRPESVAPVSLASAASDASLPITSLAEYEPPSAPASKVVFQPASALASSAVFQPPSAPASNAVFVPNFQGLALDDARRVAHENALVLEARGRGRAVAQEPAPGTIVRGARRVRVHFASIAASGEG
jgi:cell division protein FtsI (penicillin-binding protein 3)